MKNIGVNIGVLVVVLSTVAVGQSPIIEVLPYKIGGYLGFQTNFHWAQFTQLPGVPNCCPGFQGGYGMSPAVGAVLEYMLLPDLLTQWRVGYVNNTATLFEREVIGNAISNGVVVPAVSQYELSASLPMLSTDLRFSYQLIEDVPLFLDLGFNGGWYLRSFYSQREVLLEPKTAVYADVGKAVRNESSGEIPQKIPYYFSIASGFHYTLDLSFGSQQLFFQPTLSYYHGLTSILEGYKWTPDAVRLELVVLFPFEKVHTPPATPKAPAPSPTPPAMLSTAVDAVAVYEDGHRDRNVKILVEEIERGEYYPLLPYVFFEEGSADLSKSRMRFLAPEQTQQFDEQQLPPQTLEIYYHLLNIVGARMQQYPDAVLTITGCNNNLGVEKGNLELSRRRAEAVRDYFLRVWNIDSSRLIVHYRNLPAKPANNDRPEGREENRRVELSSNRYEILQPVYLQSIQRKTTPSIVEILPKVQATLPLEEWEITVQTEDTAYAHFSGTAAPPDTLPWHLPETFFAALQRKRTDRVTVNLAAQDVQGNQSIAQAVIPVELLTLKRKRYQTKNDIRYEYFSLILFDYDKADLKPVHRRILDVVKSRVEPNSQVYIEGYADRTGTPEYNRQLAKQRCLSVQQYLQPTVREDQIHIRAVGSDKLLYNNDLPEGRNYCRTVRIIIATPISTP